MKDKLLFTPGPLTTSRAVKEAMLRDLGSRDAEFIALVKDIRRRLLALAGVSQEQGYEAILLQGSGTFGVESVLSSVMPAKGRVLIHKNGAYGQRMEDMARRLKLDFLSLCENEDKSIAYSGLAWVEEAWDQLVKTGFGKRRFTHVAVVHCETTSGTVNDIAAIGKEVRKAGLTFIVDAMSSFGAYPINMAEWGIDFLISSANKCIEGVPGFTFVIARREALLASEGNARTLSLDLHAQWRGLEKDGQFRFTPPTHALLAFKQALDELDAEGGIAGRAARYQANHEVLVGGMRKMGFKEYVPAPVQSHVITTFHYPADPRFQFETFYRRLSDKGFVIYPGKLTKLDCFRIGNIGRLYEKDMLALLTAIRATLKEMGLRLPLKK